MMPKGIVLIWERCSRASFLVTTEIKMPKGILLFLIWEFPLDILYYFFIKA